MDNLREKYVRVKIKKCCDIIWFSLCDLLELMSDEKNKEIIIKILKEGEKK